MTRVLTVTQAPPSTPVLTLSGASGSTFLAGTTAYTNPQSGNSGGFTVAASTSDSSSGIKEVVFPALSGFSSGGGVNEPSLPEQLQLDRFRRARIRRTDRHGDQQRRHQRQLQLQCGARYSAPTGGALNINATAASSSGSTSYNITGGYPIAIRTDFSEAQSASQSGLRSSTLTVAAASLAGNVCGTFGSPTTIAGSPSQSEPSGCYRYTLTGVDNVGNQTSVSTTVIVDTTIPSDARR